MNFSMHEVNEISSLSNTFIKDLVRLIEKPRERKIEGKFIVEGFRECSRAMDAGLVPLEVLFSNAHFDVTTLAAQFEHELTSRSRYFSLSQQVFEKIAMRSNVANVVMTFTTPAMKDNRLLPNGEKGIWLIVDHVEKPGNLGAILRTSDGVGVNGVWITDPGTDLYNPQVIRSSLGAVFTVPVMISDRDTAIQWFNANGILTFLTTPYTTQSLYMVDLNRKIGLILGSEAKGADEQWFKHADEKIIIPMSGKVDSLNVSVAAAVVLYEARRQQG
jgi:RNA methyltransferase, TrmH family